MNVVLLDKIENLGNLGDKVTVRAGYARNYLIPGGKAKYATEANIAEFEARRAELEKNAAESLAQAEKRRDQLTDIEVTIEANVGSEGKLFGSIGPAEVADAVTAAGVALEKREIRMPEGALRHTGEFDIDVHLHIDVDTSVKVIVIGEEE
jgi:large subunit ribosomal protein L9